MVRIRKRDRSAFAVLEASDETIAQDFEGEDDDDTIARGTLS
jgi:hypothetical protein